MSITSPDLAMAMDLGYTHSPLSLVNSLHIPFLEPKKINREHQTTPVAAQHTPSRAKAYPRM